jgi:hypothetical protein
MLSRLPKILGLLLLLTSESAAETRVFIVVNPPDKGGIDRCLARGETCGASAAQSYCRSRDFADAGEFRRVDPDEITGSVPKSDKCPGGSCDEYVAIFCRR